MFAAHLSRSRSNIVVRQRKSIIQNFTHLESRSFSDDNKHVDDVTNVAILGGGITGLASAFYLTKSYPKARITIFESGSRLGSWLRSTKINVDGGHVVFEQGPRTLRPSGAAGLATLALVR